MNVGMYLIGKPSGHAEMGSIAARVAKHVMPGVDVWHLTDTETHPIDGCKVSRRERHAPMAVFRMQHHQMPGDWLFIDVDVLVTKDVRHVFDNDFDVALAERLDGDGAKGTQAFAEMPHNMGVVFSRSPDFWKAAEQELRTYSEQQQEWMGDQLAVCRLLKNWNAKILPTEYNFPPRSPTLANASIVHLKGPRKVFMPQLAAEILR
jgi:hypothetical protein